MSGYEAHHYEKVVAEGRWLYDESVWKTVRIVEMNFDPVFWMELDTARECGFEPRFKPELNTDGVCFRVRFTTHDTYRVSEISYSVTEAKQKAEEVVSGIEWEE